MNEKLSMDGLGRISPSEFQQAQKFPVIVILDNIRSGLNVGSIFRSSDAFLIEKIYCCGYTALPPHREVLKSALGATETVAWQHDASTLDIVQQLQKEGVKCYAIEQTVGSMDLTAFAPSPQQRIAIIMGNEVEGVNQDVINACDGTIEITQYGSKHSLNVAVCAGIVLFDITTKLAGQMQRTEK
jgi:23S rRNA (guanosine2251-2'-O)-methyltransferase